MTENATTRANPSDTRRPYRILITGSRHTTPEQNAYVLNRVRQAAQPHIAAGREVVVVDGDCPHGGVDTSCRRWAAVTPFATSERHPADWGTYGPHAGPRRNAEMVAAGADECQAFPAPGSRGTWDCITKAAKAGIPVHIWPLAGRRQS